MTVKLRTVHDSNVIAAPATNGATMPIANRLALAPVSGTPALRALRTIETRPTIAASGAAASHTANQRSSDVWLAATRDAAKAMTPMTTPPRPGMDVNVALRSIACRMKRRLSAARPDSGSGTVTDSSYRADFEMQ